MDRIFSRDRIPTGRRARRLVLEALERRDVPATWGIAWPDAQHLTLSFVPDGTAVEGQSSQLFGTLNFQLGTGNWESTILNAFQTWAVTSNINVGQVGDGGQAEGVAGPAQGDARFGDIRVSAIPLPAGVVAITSPYDPATGTFSGDMILNSNDNFNSSTGYDLFTVALHEAGHVFGFADSSNPSSFMYNVYTGPQTSLGSGAAAAMQALYGGPRNIVAADGDQVSTSPSKPVDLTSTFYTSNGTPPGDGDLATTGTADYFQFVAPSLTVMPLGLDLQVQTTGFSQLIPRVTVTTQSGTVIALATATATNTGISIHLANVVSGQTYLIRVDGPTNDIHAIGSYHLAVTPTVFYSNVTSNFSSATALSSSSNNTASTQITGTQQVDYYSYTTPSTLAAGMTVQLQAFGVGLTTPQVAIYTSAGTLVAQGTASSGGTSPLTVTFPTALPNTKYYIQVASGIVNSYNFGVYQVAVSSAAKLATPTTAIMQTPWLGSISAKLSTPNTSLANAAQLATPAGYAQGSLYAAMDGIGASGVAQYYDVKAPQTSSTGYMEVAVTTLGSGTLMPVVSVSTRSGTLVPSHVLNQGNGTSIIQVPYTTAGDYIVKVTASAANGGGTTGNYFMTTTFGTVGSSLATLASGTMGPVPAGSKATGSAVSISVPAGEVYEFVLQGDPTNAGSDAMLQMTVTDLLGDVVATITCLATEAASVNVLLGAGTYTVSVTASSPSKKALPALAYTLAGSNLTDPIRASPTAGGGCSDTKL